jgi:hypothetical protein
MIRRAFTLRLKRGALAEYKKHHEKIGSELVEEIERSGIARMTALEAPTRSSSTTRRSSTKAPGTGSGTPWSAIAGESSSSR